VRAPTLLVLLPASLAACSSAPSRYYVLSAQSEQTADPAGPASTTVAIGAIRLPGALDRPQIARRVGPNQFEYAEYERWAGPLDEMIRRVLIADLRPRLPAGDILIDNDSASPAKLSVAIDVLRFDADKSGQVTLEASWEQLGRNGTVVGVPGNARIVEPGSGSDAAAVAATMSHTVADLAGRIASGVGG
jgi:uncharacterized protein